MSPRVCTTLLALWIGLGTSAPAAASKDCRQVFKGTSRAERILKMILSPFITPSAISRSEAARKNRMVYLIHRTPLSKLEAISRSGELRSSDEVYLEIFGESIRGAEIFGQKVSAVELFESGTRDPVAVKGSQAVLVFRLELLDRTDYIPCLGWNLGVEKGEEFPLSRVAKLFRKVGRAREHVSNQFRFKHVVSLESLIETWVHPEDFHPMLRDLENLAIQKRETFPD